MKQQGARGKVRKFKGRVTETVGLPSVDRNLESEESALRNEDAVEENFDKARRKVGEVPTDSGKTVDKH